MAIDLHTSNPAAAVVPPNRHTSTFLQTWRRSKGPGHHNRPGSGRMACVAQHEGTPHPWALIVAEARPAGGVPAPANRGSRRKRTLRRIIDSFPERSWAVT